MKYADITKDMVLTPEAEKRILRKVDMIVLPFMTVMYGVQFMDRSTLGYSAIMGVKDIGPMVGTMYSWLTTGFYIAYLAWAFPGSWTLQKFPLVKTLCAYIFLWGFVLAMHAAVFTYPAIMVCRLFLGIFEAPLLTGLSLMGNNFYRKDEQFKRMAFIYAGTGFGNILGSVVAYGIEKDATNWVLTSWRSLFLILGVVTMVLAVAMVLVVPDLPTQAWWLSEEDKLLTVERIRDNEQGFGTKDFKWHQVKEAFLEPRAYLFAMLAICIELPNSGITAYGSILLNTEFEFDTEKALLMKAPTGVVQLFGLSLIGILNSKRLIKHPTIVALIGLCFALMGGCMLCFSKNKYAALAGFYLIGFSPISMVTALTGLSADIAGRTKKVVCNGIYLVGFCFSSAVGPQTFLASEAPNYPTAKYCLVGFYIGAMFTIAILGYYNYSVNKKRDSERDALGDAYKKVENSAFIDMTDRENKDFRYTW
ncbi:MFS general substrate transporter [Yamadazyma tenuis ATCC 10573]|uniref:MFS general substrate transporter n=2 Tax=Candida tenuis TaxID=2315449 RepID=G3BDW8_CANTC|nr:MFS general substrate transporter [Yamadazyma tenuis ATCC 10573]EGV60400.1 MFS general substrate transporter [Yamadazyma tenuis ATCC 10573]